MIAKGQALAYDSSVSKYYLADNDSATAARKTISGVSLTAASAAGLPIKVQKSGVIYISALVSVGGVYVVSSTAGGIMPYADLNTGDDIALVGVGGNSVDPASSQYSLTLVLKDSNIAAL